MAHSLSNEKDWKRKSESLNGLGRLHQSFTPVHQMSIVGERCLDVLGEKDFFRERLSLPFSFLLRKRASMRERKATNGGGAAWRCLAVAGQDGRVGGRPTPIIIQTGRVDCSSRRHRSSLPIHYPRAKRSGQSV